MATRTTTSEDLREAAIESIATRGGVNGFLAAIRHSGYCARPVRLVGKRLAVDAETGEARTTFSSDDACDGVVLKACGNRRASVCPACAATYRADARHLVAAGLAGGKGVPEAISTHPSMFVTLTAPSFGPVHSASVDRPCQPGPGERRCPHDRSLSCTGRHDRDDPALGQPLCADCYGYSDHVLWHAHAGELWRRTIVYLPRALSRGLGLTAGEGRAAFRLSFVKVVEYQSRGAIHLHAIVRADGPGRTCPGREVTLPALITALYAAARSVSVAFPEGSGSRSGCARWGEQIDATAVDGPESAHRASAYLAKYATKSTETSGALDHQVRREDLADLDARGLSDHHQRLVRTAWTLGGRPELARLGLRRWAHALGYRGHWLTKSRGYSTTLGALRAARAIHRSHDDEGDVGTATASVPVAEWRFAGVGHTTPADAMLTEALYRAAAESRRAGWEEITAGATPASEGAKETGTNQDRRGELR